MTKQAIREGFEKLRPGTQMQSLEDAARSRSEADWLVGMNATRAATIRGRAWVGGVVSLGRVQTPTLGADRQARARDPGVRPRAVPPDPRDLPAAVPGPLVRRRRDAHLRRPCARRQDRRQGLRPGRHGREGRAQGAVRARAAALRPDVAAARREPPLRLLRAAHACRPRSPCTKARRRSRIRVRRRASCPATWSRS